MSTTENQVVTLGKTIDFIDFFLNQTLFQKQVQKGTLTASCETTGFQDNHQNVISTLIFYRKKILLQ